MLWLEGCDCLRLFSPQRATALPGNTLRSGSWNETKGWEHHLVLTQEETIQLIAHIKCYHASSGAVIVLIKQLWRMMQGDRPTTSFNRASKNKASLLLHYTFLLLFLSLCVPLNPPQPFLTTWWSIYCQAICSVMLLTAPSSQKGKNQNNPRQDMMKLPRWCVSLLSWSYGWGQPTKVCVCLCVCVHLHICLQYMIVCLPQAPALWCCDAKCHPAPAWAPQPWNQLWNWQVCLQHSPTLFFSLADRHTHTHIQPHTHNETHTQTHSFMAWGLSTPTPK